MTITTTTRIVAAGATLALTALAVPAVAHHVGDKSIPGQDYQMVDDWLTDRAHMNAPWEYTPVDLDGEAIDGAVTAITTNNTRREHLVDCADFDPKPNENSVLHAVGEQFVHEAWPAVTGRNALDPEFGSPNSSGNGQVVSSQPSTAQDSATLSGGANAIKAGKG
jgi:hypothetical protein